MINVLHVYEAGICLALLYHTLSIIRLPGTLVNVTLNLGLYLPSAPLESWPFQGSCNRSISTYEIHHAGMLLNVNHDNYCIYL